LEKLKTLNKIFERTGASTGDFSALMQDFNLTEEQASEAQHICAHMLGDLKQSGMKWIKELENYGDLGEEYCQNKEELMLCTFKPALPWIKHFFGITEEDLKDGSD
jgi:hypothetical protein